MVLFGKKKSMGQIPLVNSNQFETRLCNFSFQTGVKPEKAQELEYWSIAYKLYKQD